MQAKQLYMPFMSYILLIKHVTASSGINYALIRWDAATISHEVRQRCGNSLIYRKY